jgi:hypothetical protein
MYWKGQMMSEKVMLALSLFLIGALHTMIFSIFQFPSNFLIGKESASQEVVYKLILYTCAIIVSFCHQIFCRNFGLKDTLIGGLFLNMAGLTILWINQNVGGIELLVFPTMLCFGGALTSVINSLITYIIIEFPKKVSAGTVSLFIFLNGGVMLAPLFLNGFERAGATFWIHGVLIALCLLATWHIRRRFFNPHYPAHLKHLRKGSLIWKELHYRLALFFAAIIGYGLTENTFNLWGFLKIETYFGESIANETVSLMWIFMIVGQILLLIPLYLYSTKNVLYILIPFIIGALFFFSYQTTLPGFVASLILGGIGCSAVFPILLSMMEKELVWVAKKSHLLPYVEASLSVMVAGYIFGVGAIDIWTSTWETLPENTGFYIRLASIFIGCTGVIALFLNLTNRESN